MRGTIAGVFAAATAIGLNWAATTALAGGKPNVIFILTDDQGIDAIDIPGATNELNCITPNLNRMARHGRVFPQTRVNPYCSPTRAGLLTGRQALCTGVTGVLAESGPEPDLSNLSLQSKERCLPEVLQDLGYYTMLFDKWHVGWNGAQGQVPRDQGFDEFYPYEPLEKLDDSIALGDEHISTLVDEVVTAVNGRPDQAQPYLAFVWGIDPHKRHDDTGREPLQWWKVADDLLPSGETYYQPDLANDTNLDRFRAVVESLDTEFARMLIELGENPDRDGLLDTPKRVDKSLRFLTSGYGEDIDAVINDALFEVDYSEMVIVKDIDYYSLCEHHLLPFFGKCHVAYVPRTKVIGLSKIPRIVDVFARRLQVQERLTNQIAECIREKIDPLGVAVVMQGTHLCMAMRGVEKQNSVAKTSAMLGLFRQDARTRSEFLDLIKTS